MRISEETARRAERVFAKLSNEAGASARFNPFDPDQVQAAAVLGLRFSAMAAGAAEADGAIGAVLEQAEAEAEATAPGLVQHGLALFATHSAEGRMMGKPRMMQTLPKAMIPSAAADPLEAATGVEGLLDAWRENPLANEHHQHWHEVYPAIGVQRPFEEWPPEVQQKVANNQQLTDDELRTVFRRQDRHGELFFYMHQQMIARYDAERLSMGLDPVEPLDAADLTAPIPQGFDPGPGLDDQFAPRPIGAQMDAAGAAALSAWAAEVRAAIAAGAFQTNTGGTVPITATGLGDQVEPVHPLHRGAVDQDRYGALHNTGHGVIASASPGTGVMASTATAIRDPVFYRWHKLIDDLNFEWQETQPPVAFDDAPPVRVAGANGPWGAHGIVLIDGASLPPDQAQAAALAEAVLGGDAWDTPMAPGRVEVGGQGFDVIDTLITEGRFANFPDPDNPGQTVPVPYLAHAPFAVALRLENTSAADQAVTLRLFLCPATRSEDRRFWIEMDKVPVTVPAGARTVVLRRDTDASVVKKPAEPDLSPDLVADLDGDPRCDCGWPYSLLLPRGTEGGMPFHLMAVLTDGTLDNVAPPGTCGSLSFCGARDAVYPDARPMGYPFHVPWPGPIGQTVAATGSLAGRAITIRHQPFGSA